MKRRLSVMIKIAFAAVLLIVAGHFFVRSSEVELKYDYYKSESGCAAGSVTLSAQIDGEYKLYWGDKEGNRLTYEMDSFTASYSEFMTLEVEDGVGRGEVQQFTYIPEKAEKVLVYMGSAECAAVPIPEENLPDEEEPLFTFGVLSDVHFNRYRAFFCDVADITYPNALDFLERLDVSLVALSGDISNSGEEESFESFAQINSEYGFPVFTVTGNHDVNDEFTLENWNEHINGGICGAERLPGVTSVGENRMDFTYAPEGTDDAFIFFNQIVWEYGDKETDRLVTDEQLDWLNSQLEENKDRTVYLFFHTFTSDSEGNAENTCGNLITEKGVSYDLVYTVGAKDEIRFKELLREYENVIFFSGHSHWAFDMQSYNSQLNIASFSPDGATSVHVSSVTSPRFADENSTDLESLTLRSSEGYYVEVYEDRVVLMGVDFFKGEFLSYATYVIETD